MMALHVTDIAIIMILIFFCGLVAVYHGEAAGWASLLLVLLAYAAGTRRR